MKTQQWPDLSAHMLAFEEAARKIGSNAPVRDLLREAELILRTRYGAAAQGTQTEYGNGATTPEPSSDEDDLERARR